MATAQIIPIEAYLSSTAATSGTASSPSVQQRDSEARSSSKASLDDLYPVRDELPSELIRALRLTAQGYAHAAAAHQALVGGDPIASDNEVLQLSSILPELFLCTSMGDGFRYLISAIHWSIINTSGTPLTNDQIFAIQKTLETLSNSPSIDFDSAVVCAEKLELAELDIEPKALAPLADLLDE